MNTNLLEPGLRDATANTTTILHRCNSLIQFTKQKYPRSSEQLVRLGAAAIATCSARLGSRMFIGDNAFFLWLVEGDRFIRVHGGFCYIYNGNCAFLPYSEIPPQSVLYRVCNFLCSWKASSDAWTVASDEMKSQFLAQLLQICRTMMTRTAS